VVLRQVGVGRHVGLARDVHPRGLLVAGVGHVGGVLDPEVGREFHLVEVDVAPLGHKDVRVHALDVEGRNERLPLGVLAGGHGGVEAALVDHLPGLGSQGVEENAAVQETRTSRRAIDQPVVDDHAAVDAPGRLHTAIVHDEAFGGGRAEAPGQLPIRSPKAIDPAVRAAENQVAAVEGGGRVHRAVGHETPGHLPARGVERVDGVGVAGSDKQAAIDRDGRRQPPGETGLPQWPWFASEPAGGGAGAAGVVAVERPVLWAGFRRLDFPVGGAADEALALRPDGGEGRVGSRRVGVEAFHHSPGIAEALVRRHVEHPVGRHHAVATRAARPVVLRVVLVGEADELGPAKLGDEVAVGGLGAVAAQMVATTVGLRRVDGLDDLPCGQVVAGDSAPGGVPDEATGYEEVVTPHGATAGPGRPEEFTGGGVARDQSRAVGNDEGLAVENESLLAASNPAALALLALLSFRLSRQVRSAPQGLSVFHRQAGGLGAIAEDDVALVCGEGLGEVAPGLDPPEPLARFGVECGDRAWALAQAGEPQHQGRAAKQDLLSALGAFQSA